MSTNEQAQTHKATSETESPKALGQLAKTLGVDAKKLYITLKTQVFRQNDGHGPSDQQMLQLVVLCNSYQLNPFLNEIHAYPDKSGRVVPVVGVDGWSRIVNSQADYDGMEFRYSEQMVPMATNANKFAHVWVECVIYRKSRAKPTVVREYFDEVNRVTKPWQSHPKRMHRHKALIQCARYAFGFSNLYDVDEAERILEHDITAEGSHSFATGADEEQGASHENGETYDSSPSIDDLASQFTEQELAGLNQLVTGLVERAQQLGAWQGAREWANNSLANTPSHLNFVLLKLQEAEAAATEGNEQKEAA